MRKMYLAIAMILAVVLSGCATATNGPDLVGVHYKGGELSAKEFVNCLDPSERSGFNPGDKYPAYPARQISFDATGGDSAESDPITVVSSDKAEVEVPFTVTMFLKTDCDTLRKFHETIGTRFNAFLDVTDPPEKNYKGEEIDGDNLTSGDMPEGWVDLLKFVVGKPFDVALDRTAAQYTWTELWRDPEAKQALDDAITEQVDDLINTQAGGEFFTDIQVLIQTPDPDAELKAAVVETQTQLEEIKRDRASALAEAEKQKATAKAETKTAQAQIAKARAEKFSRVLEVQGYGGPRAYLQYICLTRTESEWCINKPTYILPFGGQPR